MTGMSELDQLGLVAHVQDDAVPELPARVRAVSHRRLDGMRRAGAGLALRTTAPVVHGLDVNVPVRTHGRATVATIHDLSVYDVPWAHPGLRVRGHRLLFEHAARHADALVAVSGFTADRVRSRFGRDCTVTHLAPGRDVRPATPEDVERVRRRYGLPDDAVVTVGTVEPRKRVDLLAAACADAGLPLFLAGSVGPGGAVPDHARHLGYVPDEDLPALYAAATVVAYASCYEGFGLPPVEAMASGAAVVTTRVGALPDVVRDGAELVPVDDERALAAALRRVASDRDENAALRRAGREVAAGLSWSSTAERTVAVYHELGLPR